MSVCIELDENTAIISDAYQWSLAKLGTDPKTGDTRWIGYAHYPTLRAACDWYLAHSTRQSSATALRELADMVDSVAPRIDASLARSGPNAVV